MSDMPSEYLDPVVRTRVRAYAYLHGGGAGDAGLQLTLVDETIERAVCVRLPGPVAEQWLTDALAALRAARARAADEPWGGSDAA